MQHSLTLSVRSRLTVTTMAHASPCPTYMDVTGSVCSDLRDDQEKGRDGIRAWTAGKQTAEGNIINHAICSTLPRLDLTSHPLARSELKPGGFFMFSSRHSAKACP